MSLSVRCRELTERAGRLTRSVTVGPSGYGMPVSDKERHGYCSRMKFLRSIAAAGVAKKLIDEARKPQNQARIKSAAAALRSRTRGRRR